MKHCIPACLCLLLWAGIALSQDNVREPSTGKSFPAAVTYSYGGKDYAMSLTGVTVRKKFLFKVYGMAHYIQDPVQGTEDEVLGSVLLDGKAKQITMDFARDVDAGKISDAYMDGFKENSTADEMKSIQPLVNQFVSFFSKDVKENQQFVLRWLPGGIVIAAIAGEEKPAITSPVFARILWSIWLGKNSIVDRNDLIQRFIKE